MSSQSGITLSNELERKLRNTKGAIVIKINDSFTELVKDDDYNSTTDDLSLEFTSLHSYLSSIFPTPRYILFPSIFISFIPDTAPIKLKMLYASTKSTLTSSFTKDNTFAYSELSEINYNSYLKDSTSTDAALTSSEKTLNSINAIQDLSLGYKKQLPSMEKSGLLVDIDDSLASEFKGLAADNKGLLTFSINNEALKLIDSVNNVTLSTLLSSLEKSSPGSPFFAIYNFLPSKYSFIYSCPSGSKVKDRMIHASTKVGLINHLNGLLKEKDLKIDKSIEIGDLDELELSELKPEEAGEESASKGLRFQKPKGPRRR